MVGLALVVFVAYHFPTPTAESGVYLREYSYPIV